jgi:mannose-6-phosphate isomerase-like protein (cupin superfamily)
MLAKASSEKLICERPWGYYEVLHQDNESGYKIKRIRMKPLSRLSLQKHQYRNEIWTIITGIGLVTINDKSIRVTAGSTINIPMKSLHRMANISVVPLIFVEVQTGSYLEEDDIERFQDDYNRQPHQT